MGMKHARDSNLFMSFPGWGTRSVRDENTVLGEELLLLQLAVTGPWTILCSYGARVPVASCPTAKALPI